MQQQVRSTEYGEAWPLVAAAALLSLVVAAAASSLTPVEAQKEEKEPATIQRFVEGVDRAAKDMTAEEVGKQLNDPWAVNVLRKGVRPEDLSKALAALDGTEKFPEQDSFFVSESGQIRNGPSTKGLRRQFRMVITRGGKMETLPPILISAPAGDRSGFIELMSWDPKKETFNFYRRPSDGVWTWKGDGRDAFAAATRGKGCFACHVNGVPVMKELKLPWANWHSQAASIVPEAVSDEEIRKGPLFTKKSEAQDLEVTVRGWVQQATEARLAALMKGEKIADAPGVLRPLFVTTTTNLLASSDRSSGSSADVRLPVTLFLNFDLIDGELGIPKPPGFNTRFKRPLYQEALTTFDFRLKQGDDFEAKGDTYFASVVPEPSLEDVVATRRLIARKVITRHFAACVLLVDFPNPVFSPDREKLLRYVPASGAVKDGKSDLAERTAEAVLKAARDAPNGSPEKQFSEWWAMTPDGLKAEAAKRVQAYLTAVQMRLKGQEGVDDYVRLTESRRRAFAKAPLNEFPLLLPRTNLAAASYRMKADGTIIKD